jgi:ADP-ribosylglycohydrolase
MQLSLKTVAERVRQEIEVRDQQGYAVDGLMAEWECVRADRDALLALHEKIEALPRRADWPYEEPLELVAIRRVRPQPVELPRLYLSEQEIRDKIHGAWLGRAVGCVLGKPLEQGLSQADIKEYLQGANAYPLTDFVPPHSRSKTLLRRDCVPSMRGYVEYAQEDDDLNYMCLAVKLLEQQGPSFTTLDVGMNWLASIPFLWTWGPEHVVYLNLANAVGEHQAEDINLDAISSFLNPGTERIGAQIRTDVYGYVCPNAPEQAAEFAWRDAFLTHRQSGLYGALWVAAMNAAAFALRDAESVVRAGLAQVPARSRFAEAILQTIEWYHADGNWDRTGGRIAEHFDRYGFAGTINNACRVTAALLYGWGDGTHTPAEVFEKTITIAVQLGQDTDCNGATAGSVVGLMLGAHALPEKWTIPLHDTLHTCVVGFGKVSIAEMAERTYQLSRILRPQTQSS